MSDQPSSLEPRLRAGLGDLGLDLADAQVGQLLQYVGLLQKWSRVYNLTAVRDPDEMLTHHLLDSLAVVLPLRAQAAQVAGRALRVLDVGSGAGLPGVVLAICNPGYQVDCVDTVGKKTAFVQQVAASLGLGHERLRGVHARVESVVTGHDVICARAFASLADLVTLSGKALSEGGVWLAMKGRRPDEEIAELAAGAALPQQAEVFHVEPLQVPGLAAQRCIVWMRKWVERRME